MADLHRKVSQDGAVPVAEPRLASLDVSVFQFGKRIGREFPTETALKIGKFDNAYRRAMRSKRSLFSERSEYSSKVPA
jgi:hypothetical protein